MEGTGCGASPNQFGCGVSFVLPSYRLRSSGPFYAMCNFNRFIIQTFGAEERIIKGYEATQTLLTSCDMMALGGNYEQASYSALPYKNSNGAIMFTGTEVTKPTFIDESALI
jgi:hypothetical protein